jgi:hypothetical protein
VFCALRHSSHFADGEVPSQPVLLFWMRNNFRNSYTLISDGGGGRKMHNEELRDLYSSQSIIKIINSRRMRWVGHVVRLGEKRNV